MLKRNLIMLGLILITFFLVACNQSPQGNENSVADATDLDLLQAGQPRDGDTVVTLHTSMGDIVIRMFPQEAPMAYVNFVTHAMNGYYDGVIFHRVIDGFMIQGGDPLGTGTGGESIWGHGFESEFSPYLRHFRGALAMAHAGPGTNGSQFYIVQNSELDGNSQLEFLWAKESQDEPIGDGFYVRDIISAEIAEAYVRYGGTPFLDLIMNPNGHTVFGQVTTGMAVVDAIATVNAVADRPVTDVVINRVTVTGSRLAEISADEYLEELWENF